MSVEFECDDRVATITLNRPEKMNAMDPEMYSEISARLRQIDEDPDIWAGIITGAGDRAFSAGADLTRDSEMVDSDGWSAWRPNRFDDGLEVGKPLIAAINGYCLAGGLELALFCDIRVASERSQFGVPEVNWNLINGYGALRLPDVVGLSNALHLVLTGDPIDAQEAHRLGLVQEVVPHKQVRQRARALADRVCENGPIAVRMTKEMTLRSRDMSLADGFRLYQEYGRVLMQSEDVAEGNAAFAEGRKPTFKNR